MSGSSTSTGGSSWPPTSSRRTRDRRSSRKILGSSRARCSSRISSRVDRSSAIRAAPAAFASDTVGPGPRASRPSPCIPTMHILDDFIAVGTQIKTERPGKAGAVTPCDTIEGPLVVLDTGDFIEVPDAAAAKRLSGHVRMIADLGEILIPFGEFLENNHVLMPGGFSLEWYGLLLQKALGSLPGGWEAASAAQAMAWSRDLGIPP